MHWVPGPRAVAELLRADPQRVRRVIVVRKQAPEEIAALAESHGIPVQLWDPERLAEVLPDLDVRGVVAEARPPRAYDPGELWSLALEGPSPRIVVALDGVQDPQNLGAIMRTCEYFGVSGLLWSRDRSAGLTASVVRASAGASERLPLAIITNLVRTLMEAKKRDFWVVGTVVEGGQPLATLVERDALPDPLVLVLGAEQHGLRRLTRERCDMLATIPRRGEVGSLNVAAAAAATLAMIVGRGRPGE